jgi:hypothetical protein
LAPVEDEIAVVAGKTTTVFLVSATQLGLQVLDPISNPIEGALVAWIPARKSVLPGRAIDEPTMEATSDSAGRVSLSLSNGAVGSIGVSALGFEPQRVALRGRVDDTLVVHLEPCVASGQIVHVVDALTGVGVPQPRLRVSLFAPLAPSGGDGVLELPEWVRDENELRVSAPGYSTTLCLAGEARRFASVVLWPAVATTLAAVDHDEAALPSSTIWVEPPATEAPAGEVPDVTVSVTTDSSGQATVVLPEGVRLRATVLTRDGRAGSSEFSVYGAGTRVVLRAATDPEALWLVPAQGIGSLGNELRVHATYGDSRSISLALRGDETIAIARPNEVSGFEVLVPGFAASQYRPTPGYDGRRGGTLKIALQRAVEQDVRVLDEQEVPVPGLLVSLFPPLDPFVLLEQPELQGGWPTEHPGWTEVSHTAATDVSDSEGRASLRGLTPGDYDVQVTMPGVLDPDAPSLYPIFAASIHVPTEGTVTVYAARPRRAILTVRDAWTGAPVHEFRLRFDGRHVAAMSTSSSSTWDGWIPDNVTHLMLVADGYVPRPVLLDDSPGVAAPRLIHMTPEEGMFLALEGPAVGELVGERVVIRALQPLVDPENGAVGGKTEVWRCESLVDDGGGIALAAPVTMGTELELLGPGQASMQWTFEPSTFAWQPGSRATIRALWAVHSGK